MDIAGELAKRAQETDDAGDVGPAVQQMHELLGLLPPSAYEQTQALNFAQKHGLVALARVLLNTNALIYLD